MSTGVKNKSLVRRYVNRLRSRLKNAPYHWRMANSRRRMATISQAVRESGATVGLDLGCGAKPRNEFDLANVLGFDLYENPECGVFGLDISRERLPIEDGSVDLVTAYDFIEHIPRWERVDESSRFPFIEVMNEISRVLKTGGLFFSRTPAFPHPEVFRDPTHVNIITEETFPYYFAGKARARGYGFTGFFEVVEQKWDGPKLITLLRKA